MCGLTLLLNRPLPRIKRQYLGVNGQILNCFEQNFEQGGLYIWNIVSQNVRYLTVYGLMLPLNPGEGRFKGAIKT